MAVEKEFLSGGKKIFRKGKKAKTIYTKALA